MIPYNKPYLTGKESEYINLALANRKLCGAGPFTKKCTDLLKSKYGFPHVLLTSSCTDALEMAAILCDIQPGDEVIMPSYTFVSTANPFVLRGAVIRFADSRPDHPGLDESKIETLISSKTKCIVAVHYAGVACDMSQIMEIANRHGIKVVEDAAQAIDSFHHGKPLGTFGHLACFSLHATKNIIAGEGGMLVVNDQSLIARSEIIWEKGTNRAAFFRGEVDKYGWVDMGSSFLPSELTAAFLLAQLENMDAIQAKRVSIWNHYYETFLKLNNFEKFKLPYVPEHASKNAHIFHIVCANDTERDALMAFLKSRHFGCISLSKPPFQCLFCPKA